jgi:serine/threonine protein kinase
MWSLGVITHMLLSGDPPFGELEDDDDTILMKIRTGGEATMDGEVWKDISEEARDFVASC